MLTISPMKSYSPSWTVSFVVEILQETHLWRRQIQHCWIHKFKIARGIVRYKRERNNFCQTNESILKRISTFLEYIRIGRSLSIWTFYVDISLNLSIKSYLKISSEFIVKVSIYSETVYNDLTAHDKIIYQTRPLNARHETNRIPQKSIRLIS